MSLGIKKVLPIALLAVVAVFPFGVDYFTTSKLNESKQQLINDGIKLEVLNKDGIIDTKREITLVLDDANKFIQKAIDKTSKENPEYAKIMEGFFQSDKYDMNEALKGIRFQGVMTSNNYLFEKPRITLSLKELPTVVMDELKKNINAAQLVMPLLEKGVITLDMVVGFDQKLESLKLKDINENMNIANAFDIKFGLLGSSIDIDDTIVKAKIDKQEMSFSGQGEFINFSTEDIKSQQDIKSNYNQSHNLSFKNLNFTSFTDNKKEAFVIKSGSMKDAIKEKENFLDSFVEYELNKASYSLNSMPLAMLEKISLDLQLNSIEKKSVESVVKSYYDLFLIKQPEDKERVTKEFTKTLMTVLNKGFDFEVHSKIDKAKFLMGAVDKISLDIDTKLKANTIDENTPSEKLLEYVDLDAKLVLDDKSAQLFAALSPNFRHFMRYAKSEKDTKIFNINIKNSKLIVNDNPIQYN